MATTKTTKNMFKLEPDLCSHLHHSARCSLTSTSPVVLTTCYSTATAVVGQKCMSSSRLVSDETSTDTTIGHHCSDGLQNDANTPAHKYKC